MHVVSERSIRNACAKVQDPELGLDIVHLGFIYSITVDRQCVTVVMTLTTPGCPLASSIISDTKKEVERIAGGRRVVVELTFDPPWTPDRIVRPETKRHARRTIQTRKAQHP